MGQATSMRSILRLKARVKGCFCACGQRPQAQKHPQEKAAEIGGLFFKEARDERENTRGD